uniref:Uncharacterized protein n=1 Tax=Romanomermis culicivorax TaxID=13658 RepID=A0A915KBF8_ROMCU
MLLNLKITKISKKSSKSFSQSFKTGAAGGQLGPGGVPRTEVAFDLETSQSSVRVAGGVSATSKGHQSGYQRSRHSSFRRQPLTVMVVVRGTNARTIAEKRLTLDDQFDGTVAQSFVELELKGDGRPLLQDDRLGAFDVPLGVVVHPNK